MKIKKPTLNHIVSSATTALNEATDLKTKAKLAEQYSKMILERISFFDYDYLWPKEYKTNIYRFLINAYTSKFLRTSSYTKLCNLYLRQTALLLKKKWEKVFIYIPKFWL